MDGIMIQQHSAAMSAQKGKVRAFSGLVGRFAPEPEAPAILAVSELEASEQKSAAALRAAAWRAKQGDLKRKEAERKREQRQKQRNERMEHEWLAANPGEVEKATESLRRANAIANADPASHPLLKHGTDGPILHVGTNKVRLSGGSAEISKVTDAIKVRSLIGGKRTAVHDYDSKKDDGFEQENTFARKLNFKRAAVISIRIGMRIARFYNIAKPFEDLIAEYLQQHCAFKASEPTGEFDEDQQPLMWPPEPMICKLCSETIYAEYNEELGLEHFGHNHRQHLIEHLRSHEPAAYRPKKRVCPEDHAALAGRQSGKQKVYCGKCHKLIYKPKCSDAAASQAKPATNLVN